MLDAIISGMRHMLNFADMAAVGEILFTSSSAV
jgi:hypothetical protein